MARQTKTEKLASIHAEMLTEFDAVQSACRDERIQCLEDRRFSIIAGAMWEGPEEALFSDRPKFEVNKIDLGVLRIQSEYRNNRIAADFVSKDGEASEDMADTCDSLYRADCTDSGADEAKDNAFDEAVRGGIGAYRLCTAYENEFDDDDDKQRIRFEPINDADSCVFFDLGAKRQDKSDAKRCWVLTPIPIAQYMEEYGDDPASWQKDISRSEFDWASPDVVWVAEYYRVETQKYIVKVYQTITGEEERYTSEDFERDEKLQETLDATGSKLIKEKQTKRRRVRKYIASGGGILEDCGYIAGPNIPIVIQYGKRYVVDGIERCSGYVRTMKDVTRLKNMQMSALGHIAALSPVEKPILGAEQVANPAIRMMWEQDSIQKYPYLLLDAVTDASGNKVYQGPIGYTKPPQVPPALAAIMQITQMDMQDLMGNQQQADKIVSNISGKAVDLMQQRMDMQSYIYISNSAKAEKRAAEIWLGMAKEIYVEDGRKLKTIGAQGEIGSIEINRPVIAAGGEVEYENDLSRADFDVSIEVGPSSSTRRQSMIHDLINMMSVTTDPESQQVLQAMIMYNMEGEGIAEYRDYWRQKLVKMGAVKPSEEEAKAMAEAAHGQQPDPNSVYLQAAAEEAQAKAAKARADTVYTIANAENKRANTAKTISEIDANEQAQALEVIDRFTPQQPEMPDVTAVVVPPQQ